MLNTICIIIGDKHTMINWENYNVISEEEIKKGLLFSAEQDKKMLSTFTHQFKKAYSVNGYYEPVENTDWTEGFWTGELWLNYENTLDVSFKEAAEIQIENFMKRIKEKVNVEHHDMGFLYSLSCVAGYKLTGNETGKEAALLAAEQLISRYHSVGEYIQAWGSMNSPDSCRLIIDCLLNLPLLYWASEITGDSKYEDIAKKHIHTTLSNVIREDYSTWHTFYFDPVTGEPSHGATCQGYRDGSAWARGQAWGIYGLALSYRYTKEPLCIDMFKNVANYFLSKLPDDLIPYWDLEFTSGDEPRDSSSAVIAVCGMLEMIKYLDEKDSNYYKEISLKIMKSVYDNYAVKEDSKSNGLLLHSTYSNRSPYNTCNHCGVDECNSWGDYFYLEALTRLSKDWNLYW